MVGLCETGFCAKPEAKIVANRVARKVVLVRMAGLKKKGSVDKRDDHTIAIGNLKS